MERGLARTQAGGRTLLTMDYVRSREWISLEQMHSIVASSLYSNDLSRFLPQVWYIQLLEA